MGGRGSRSGAKVKMFGAKPGKADNTSVNFDYISSSNYEDIFRTHYSDNNLSDSVLRASRQILKNRDGTKYEELYAIDSRNGKVLTYIKGKAENGIEKTVKLEKLLTNSPSSSIIIIHNHPNSSTFSRRDVSTALSYSSISETVAVGHNGKVFFISGVYGHNNVIRDYSIAYTKHVRDKMTDFEARNRAWEDVSKQSGFLYERR